MNEEPQKRDRRGIPLQVLPMIVIVLILGAATWLIVQPKSSNPLPGNAKSYKSQKFDGLALRPLRQAPPIRLRNYLGKPVSLGQYKGEVVLVTFLYAHCPNVCPLIASQLRVAQTMLGSQAKRVQIIAVSVDPRNDTPSSVATFLNAHQMTGRMQYLLGSLAQLARVWKAWNVGSRSDANQPDLVAHTALVYGVTVSGKIATIYPATFDPSQIVHDVPLLAKD